MTRSSTTRAGAPRVAPGGTGHRAALLAAKLAPPELAHATVQRPRLLGQLSRAVQRSPVTLLSGQAGSGKTVLAASWRKAQRDARPTAWLTLDDYDDDPAAFWGYVIQALSGEGVPFPDLPQLVPGEPPPGWLVPELAAWVAALPRPVVLVLDNADHLTDRSLTAGLDLLVRNAGGRLRLVLCGRTDPLLPLHRYRLAGTLAEIRCEELGFTPEEARELFAAMGVPVPLDVARALCAETQGWAVGLRLAAAPLKRGVPPDRLVTSLAHDDGSVAQYLFAEVFEVQPAHVRRFLLQTSVTADLVPDLVDRLADRPNGRRILAALAHANAFVEESPGDAAGFRINPLFREMLQAQLAYENPAELAALHRECATWYAEQGRAPEAVGHAIAAEDWGLVTRLLIDDLLVVRLLAHGSDPALRGLRSLPASLGGPEVAVIRTAVALAEGRRPDPVQLAAVATARGSASPPALRLSATLTHLASGAERDPAAALAEADAAADLVAEIPEDDRRERRDCAAVLAGVRAAARLRSDAPVEHLVVELRSAATAAHAAAARQLRCRLVAQLALVEAVTGHLARAVQLAEEAEGLAAEEVRDDARKDPASATAMAWVHLRRYALLEGREWLTRARDRDLAARAASPGVVPLLAVLQSQLFRLRHEFDAAEQVLAPYLEGARLPGWVAEQVVGETVRLAAARGRPDDALAAARDAGDAPWGERLRTTAALLGGAPAPLLLADAEQSLLPAVAVESAVLRACQLAEQGSSTAAVQQLTAALVLARPELMRWPFVDAPAPARRLLRTHPRLQGPAAWLSPSAGPRPGPGMGPASQEPAELVQELSERELEVLGHLAEMLSTAEIAATMFISVNTVRTHIRSILRKLAVSRRNQAVRRARERGIL